MPTPSSVLANLGRVIVEKRISCRFLRTAAALVLAYRLFLVIFGRNAATISAMGFIAALASVILKTVEGVLGVGRVLIDVGRGFSLTACRLFRKVEAPAAVPAIFTGLRLGFGIAVIGTMLAETKLSNKGLGYLIVQYYAQFDMSRMYAALIFVFAFAAAINAALTRLADRQARKNARKS